MASDNTIHALSLKNPLDSFVSYSTHFIILAARTTENARVFTEEADNKATLDAINRVEYLGERVPYAKAQGDVFLVVDTRRFSQFTVENMKYESLINGLSAGQSHANLVNILEMTVLDSVGISFINYMQWLMDTKMQTNFDGLIFLIRTVFVGHNPDGSTQTVQSITIPCHLFKMEMNLDYAKGVYNLEFMPNFNFSPTTHSRWLNIGTASSFFSGVSQRTLKGMVDAFEERLNKQSEDFYRQISPQIVQAGATPRGASGKFGRMVKYQITIPKEWEGLTFTGANVNAAEERSFVNELKKTEAAKTSAQQKNTASTDGKEVATKDAHMAVGAGMTVTEVLDAMFKQVKGISDFANSEKVSATDQFIRFHKHVVSISSDEETVIVHVDVVPFDVPNLRPPSKADSKSVSQHESQFYKNVPGPSGTTKRVPKNYFEMNYIYTGQNLDILNFDMKIQDLQFMLASNTRVSEGELISQSLQGQTDKTSSEEGAKPEKRPEILSARPYDPLLLPMLTEAQSKAFSHLTTFRTTEAEREAVSSQQQYARNLSAFYAISPVQVAMTIKGNPDIMAKFNIGTFAPHIVTSTNTGENSGVSNTNPTSKAEYRQQFEQRILNKPGGAIKQGTTPGTFTVERPLGSDSYASSPTFVRVVVKGPNVDFVTNELVNGEDFAKEVLFDNYYVVFKVTNIIERGVFTQQLELWSHNVFGMGKLTSEQIDKQKVKLQ